MSVPQVPSSKPPRSPSQKPFRFGVQIEEASSAGEWLAKVRRAEQLGYSVLTIADHLRYQLSPTPALAMAASATKRLRLGTFVLGNDYRHPAFVAKEAATLDVLSGGRFELGIGAGWMRSEYEQLGLPFDPHPVRLARLEEAVRIVSGMLSGETVTLEGSHYRIHELVCDPRPVQRPRPPILIGGGSKQVLSLAARMADIVGINLRVKKDGTLDYASISRVATEEKIGWIAEAAGSRFKQVELNAYVYFVLSADEAEKTVEEKRAEAPTITLDFLLYSPHSRVGTAQEMAAQLLARREALGISYITVQEHNMERLAPVIVELAETDA